MPSRRWRLSGRLEPRAEVVSRLKWEASVIIVHSLRTLPKAPQAKPIEAQRRLDDPKDRFDGLLAQGVEFAPGFGRQPVRHHRGGAGCGLGGGWVGPFFERLDSSPVRLAGGDIHRRARRAGSRPPRQLVRCKLCSMPAPLLPAPSGAALRAKAPPFGCLAPLGS